MNGDIVSAAQRYSTTEVVRATGATERRLDYWVRTRFLEPAYRAIGSGDQHRWSFADVVRAACIVVLLDDAGFSLQRLRRTFQVDDEALLVAGMVELAPSGLVLHRLDVAGVRALVVARLGER